MTVAPSGKAITQGYNMFGPYNLTDSGTSYPGGYFGVTKGMPVSQPNPGYGAMSPSMTAQVSQSFSPQRVAQGVVNGPAGFTSPNMQQMGPAALATRSFASSASPQYTYDGTPANAAYRAPAAPQNTQMASALGLADRMPPLTSAQQDAQIASALGLVDRMPSFAYAPQDAQTASYLGLADRMPSFAYAPQAEQVSQAVMPAPVQLPRPAIRRTPAARPAVTQPAPASTVIGPDGTVYKNNFTAANDFDIALRERGSRVNTAGKSYKAESGDTLKSIADDNGVTVDELKKFNPKLTDSNLYGKTVRIPRKRKAGGGMVRTSKGSDKDDDNSKYFKTGWNGLNYQYGDPLTKDGKVIKRPVSAYTNMLPALPAFNSMNYTTSAPTATPSASFQSFNDFGSSVVPSMAPPVQQTIAPQNQLTGNNAVDNAMRMVLSGELSGR